VKARKTPSHLLLSIMLLGILFPALLRLPSTHANPVSGAVTDPAIRTVYTFGINTFIENIAIRSNSKLLLTSLSRPSLWSVDPTVALPTAPIIHTFANTTGLSGITETTPDVFALITGTWDLPTTRAAIGSLTVWTLDFNCQPPTIKNITSIVNSTVFNAITTVPGKPNLILAADSAIGAVWKVNLVTGRYDIAFSDPLFQPISSTPGENLGVNGLLAKGNYLYYANSARNIYGRVRINAFGDKISAVEIIGEIPIVGGNYDDFDLDAGKNGWIATHPHHVIKVRPDGTQKILANATALKNPTAAEFGRGSAKERRTLYVTNGGEFTETFDLINGGVVSFDTARF
jgi:hypothetical protein